MAIPQKKQKNPGVAAPKKELAYYLTVFKIENHSTWRSFLGGNIDVFAGQVEAFTKVTEKKTYRVDRISGEIKEI